MRSWGLTRCPEVARIVREAVEHRRRRLAVAPAEQGRERLHASRVKAGVAALDRARPEARESVLERTPGPGGRGAAPGNGKTRPKAPQPTHIEVHARPVYIPDYATPRFRLTPAHFAYVKIAEGCNHPCSFCIIPRMRGSHRSRSQADVVEEVRRLVAEGVKEINLISQDSTYYGLDLRPNRAGSVAAPGAFATAARALPGGATTLVTLLRELDQLPGDFWIRLLYTHPAHWTNELIRTLGECRKVARYVDMPLQHIHDNLLERMRRETSRAYIEDLIARIRSGVPGIALRTTFIVGFPGETEAAFETLLEFIRATRFERLGVFTYSREEGTRAGRMAGQVPDVVKQERRARAMAEQLQVVRKLGAARIGQAQRVLVERRAATNELQPARIESWEHGLIRSGSPHNLARRGVWYVTRGEADAPDIDGRVFVRGRCRAGEFLEVRVVAHTDYDLYAEPIREFR
jgi:ribosomal protein S12 methylthiotransferase